jgi:hypothetical protein
MLGTPKKSWVRRARGTIMNHETTQIRGILPALAGIILVFAGIIVIIVNVVVQMGLILNLVGLVLIFAGFLGFLFDVRKRENS